MQLSAGPDLPHTRSGAVHWLSTAAVLAAVVAAAALVQPADASTKDGAADAKPPRPTVPAPDPHAAKYPLTCAPGASVDVTASVKDDMDGDGRPETVAVVRCQSDTGTPPNGVYVLSSAKSGKGAPKIAAMLVNPRDDRQVTGLYARGAVVGATVLGYSSDSTPRCCPDMKRDYTWEWRTDTYVAIPGAAPGSI
ncbi:hypothetical protein [Actinacidiphila yeochonensis]|uniref:hypothetical protein n=1 Tax=Actinacidiphila yeochonensis TaxID=89050 RepID=UPI00056A4D33|nr:hypothetical protein [Actinacidiphila yeochonensis]